MLYNSNLEISKEFETLKEDFKERLEGEITKYYSKDTLEMTISDLYKKEVKELDSTQVDEIKQNIIIRKQSFSPKMTEYSNGNVHVINMY